MYNYLICNKFNFSQKYNNIEKNHRMYMISVFDDGNQKYKELENKWIITGNPRHGKVTLLHNNSSLVIKSISAWKIQIIEDHNK
jgi:hypothetical protein